MVPGDKDKETVSGSRPRSNWNGFPSGRTQGEELNLLGWSRIWCDVVPLAFARVYSFQFSYSGGSGGQSFHETLTFTDVVPKAFRLTQF